MTSSLLWRCLLVHAVHCSVAQRSRLIPLSVSPNSDESRKQSLYPDGDSDRHQSLIICTLAHCQPSPKISCKSVWKYLHKVANRQTNRQTNKRQRKHNLLGGGNNDNNITVIQKTSDTVFAVCATFTNSVHSFVSSELRHG